MKPLNHTLAKNLPSNSNKWYNWSKVSVVNGNSPYVYTSYFNPMYGFCITSEFKQNGDVQPDLFYFNPISRKLYSVSLTESENDAEFRVNENSGVEINQKVAELLIDILDGWETKLSVYHDAILLGSRTLNPDDICAMCWDAI